MRTNFGSDEVLWSIPLLLTCVCCLTSNKIQIAALQTLHVLLVYTDDIKAIADLRFGIWFGWANHSPPVSWKWCQFQPFSQKQEVKALEGICWAGQASITRMAIETLRSSWQRGGWKANWVKTTWPVIEKLFMYFENQSMPLANCAIVTRIDLYKSNILSKSTKKSARNYLFLDLAHTLTNIF